MKYVILIHSNPQPWGHPTQRLTEEGRAQSEEWHERTDREFDARVHWGKLHFLTRAQLLERYPRAEDFVAIRRTLDPTDTFLNGHLAPLFS